MTPLEHFTYLVDKNIITEDNEQLAVVKKLQQLYEQLTEAENKSLIKKLTSKRKQIKGFYLWGGVGTGKTFMMDNFFNALPFNKKLRMHFHSFMQFIHYELKEFQGQAYPIKKIAKEISNKAKVLVLDELIVNDITDAMLLAELFHHLIDQKITLLFTTNIHPDDLYKNGLQRQRFIPTIELIKKHCEIYHLKIQHDYRQKHIGIIKNYLTPLNTETQNELERRFLSKAKNSTISNEPIEIHHRKINIVKMAEHILWLDFMDLCNIPRSQRDYLYLAQHYSTIIVSNLRQIMKHETNLARSLINFIDVMYDNRIQVIISAETSIDKIYTEGKLLFPFTRTQSRITEMQADFQSGEMLNL